MRDKYFTELDPKDFTGKTVILDVDGTIVANGVAVLLDPEKQALAELAQVSQVYLCSNTRSTDRIRTFATSAGATYVDTPFKKPNPRIMETVPMEHQKEVVVVGDKFLTDGLLALRIKAEFVKVRRIHFWHEHPFTHLAYIIDGILGRPVYWLLTRFHRTP